MSDGYRRVIRALRKQHEADAADPPGSDKPPLPVLFWGKDGFRWVTCPLCGKSMRVTSWPDDTRWRYPSHADGGPDDERCDNSQELLPRGLTTLPAK